MSAQAYALDVQTAAATLESHIDDKNRAHRSSSRGVG